MVQVFIHPLISILRRGNPKIFRQFCTCRAADTIQSLFFIPATRQGLFFSFFSMLPRGSIKIFRQFCTYRMAGTIQFVFFMPAARQGIIFSFFSMLPRAQH
jgi:hypothetical protein